MADIKAEYLACPIRNVLSRFGDKWSMLVLYSLNTSETGVLRFNELRRHMADCSQKMLSQTLKNLRTRTRTVRAQRTVAVRTTQAVVPTMVTATEVIMVTTAVTISRPSLIRALISRRAIDPSVISTERNEWRDL